MSEAKERLRAALTAMYFALPPKRITLNLSPADLPKEASRFDLPIALDVILAEDVAATVAFGELSLYGSLVSVIGALPAAMGEAQENRSLMCPQGCGAEAAWVDAVNVLASDIRN